MLTTHLQPRPRSPISWIKLSAIVRPIKQIIVSTTRHQSPATDAEKFGANP